MDEGEPLVLEYAKSFDVVVHYENQLMAELESMARQWMHCILSYLGY